MSGDITEAVRRLQDGDFEAGFDFEKQVRAFLLGLVRSRRDDRLRARIDSEGVVNAALNSFMIGAAARRFPNLENRKNIKRLLATMIFRILMDETNAGFADKRTPLAEVTSTDGRPEELASGTQATPDQCSEAEEFIETFPEIVREVHPKAIEIMELSLEGLTNFEIAESVGLGVRRVQTIKKEMQAAWSQVNGE